MRLAALAGVRHIGKPVADNRLRLQVGPGSRHAIFSIACIPKL